jgi:hypothetical protein
MRQSKIFKMSNSFQPIQYSSINDVVELDDYPKNKLQGSMDEVEEGEESYSFDDDAREPLLNLEVINGFRLCQALLISNATIG